MFLTVKNKSLDITNLKSVIFDMDGTLIESEHVWAEAKKHIAEIYGQKVSDEELQKFIGRGISDFIDEVFGPTTVFKKEMIKQEIHVRALDNYRAKIRVIPNATKILNDFSSSEIRIAICSSGPLKAIEQSLEALKSTKMIEVIVSGDALDFGKPHPLPYQLTLQKLNLEPWNAIVFEDTVSGLRSANAAGIPTIYVGEHTGEPIIDNTVLTSPYLSDFNLVCVCPNESISASND